MKSQHNTSIHKEYKIYENISVEKVVPGGDGLVRLNGKVVFVPGVLESEKIDISIISEGRRFSRGRVEKLKEASPKRIEPGCPYYGRCGGCNLQHIGYEEQLSLKESFVREHFQRLAGIILPDNFYFVSSEPWAYRNRVQFHRSGEGVGFMERGSNDILTIQNCPVLANGLNDFLASGKQSEKDRETFFSDGNQWWSESDGKEIKVSLKGQKICFRADLFFQSNLTLLPDLIDFALFDVSGEHGMDLYCGVGLFSVFMKQNFKRITAIEMNPKVEEFYLKNMGDFPFDFSPLSLESWIRNMRKKTSKQADFILVDPPRTGLSEHAKKFLIKMKARELCYVSCDPVTQARDTKELLAAGYELTGIRGFDFYPQTHHMETVVRFRLT